MTSIYRVLDLLETVNNASHHENEVLTTAGTLTDLATWAYIWSHEGEGVCRAIGFLDWLRREAQKYETSVNDGSAADYKDPEYWEWLNEQGRRIRAKIEEGY